MNFLPTGSNTLPVPTYVAEGPILSLPLSLKIRDTALRFLLGGVCHYVLRIIGLDGVFFFPRIKRLFPPFYRGIFSVLSIFLVPGRDSPSTSSQSFSLLFWTMSRGQYLLSLCPFPVVRALPRVFRLSVPSFSPEVNPVSNYPFGTLLIDPLPSAWVSSFIFPMFLVVLSGSVPFFLLGNPLTPPLLRIC